MKKVSIKNYLLVAFFALVIVGVIYLSILLGSVKYFGYFMIILAVLFTVAYATQHTNHKRNTHFRSKSREEMLRHQIKE